MRFHFQLTAIAATLALASCSGGNSNQTAVTVASIDVSEFKGQKALGSAATIDSLALEADFLTPEQGVTVLVGLSEIAKNEEMKQKPEKRLEYMRKFIDTYDILSDRGDEFKQAIANSTASTGINLTEIANRYRDVLNDEADGYTLEGEEGTGTTTTAAPSASAPKADTEESKTPEAEQPADKPAEAEQAPAQE